MSEAERYNGYRNFVTWQVSVWLDNSQELLWRFEQIGTALENPDDLSEWLQAYFDALNPVEGSGDVYSDLMQNALSQVDWERLAERILDQD
jgi:hypothetical protein